MSVVGTFLPPSVSPSEPGPVGEFVRRWIETERGKGFVYHRGFLARDRETDHTVDRLARLTLTLALPRGTNAQVCMDLGLDDPPMGVACLVQRKIGKGKYEYLIFKRKTRTVTRRGLVAREPLS